MQLDDLCHGGARIIEIDPPDEAFASRLSSRVGSRYLAVVASDRRRKEIVRRNPRLESHVAVAPMRAAVRQNNADVLILNRQSLLQLANYRSVRHAQHVAVRIAASPLSWLGIQLALLQCVLGFLAWPRLVRCDGAAGTPWLLAYRVRRRRPNNRVRRFIPYALGVEGFLRRLRSDGIRHAVLRWFEDLPAIAPGEDLDLLVADCDLEVVRAMLDEGPGVQPVDLYSVTGLPGADYRMMAYFPVYAAEELLQRAVDHRGLCRVPAAREHFLSLAYHALYHKGYDSGLPARDQRAASRARSDHDYGAVLSDLAGQLGIRVRMTLEDLDEYLGGQGWRPPYDMRVRLSRSNAWLESIVRKEAAVHSADDGLAVFLLREEARKRGGVERAAAWLQQHGFQIVHTLEFDAQLAQHVAREVRGGNWGRGPWNLSGGGPMAAIVAYDPAPIRTTWGIRKRRLRHVANVRLNCKGALRDHFNEGYPDEQHCNVVHSSDNGREALEYLRIIMPERCDEIVSRMKPVRTAQAA